MSLRRTKVLLKSNEPAFRHVRVYYEKNAFQSSLVLPKLSVQIQRHGFHIEPKILLELVIGYAKRFGSGFVTKPGPAFNYRPCGFGPRNMKTEIIQNLLRVERDMVQAALEIVFCGKDTHARNSNPIELSRWSQTLISTVDAMSLHTSLRIPNRRMCIV